MDNYFLGFSLFFPRLTLLYFYEFAKIPMNHIPFWADATLAIFLPRLLVLFYIYQNLGADNPWFVAHIIFAILAYAGGGSTVTKKKD